jgi:hypothetical protein
MNYASQGAQWDPMEYELGLLSFQVQAGELVFVVLFWNFLNYDKSLGKIIIAITDHYHMISLSCMVISSTTNDITVK